MFRILFPLRFIASFIESSFYLSSIDFGPCHLDQSVLYPSYELDRRKSAALGSPCRRISGGSAVSGTSPKASPRNSPFTSPRGSNQWSGAGGSRASVGDVSVSRRGSRLDVEIRETPQEEEVAEAEERMKNTNSANLASTTAGSGRRQQLLTIPSKGMELSSSAETLSG